MLVIEDEADIADFVVRGLSRRGLCCGIGRQRGRRLAAPGRCGMGCRGARLRLPGEDGLSLLNDIEPRRGKSSVLFLTAPRHGNTDRVRGLDGGADDYLCKPFAFAELLARLRALCRRSISAATTCCGFADLQIDLAARRVERAGKTGRAHCPRGGAARLSGSISQSNSEQDANLRGGLGRTHTTGFPTLWKFT